MLTPSTEYPRDKAWLPGVFSQLPGKPMFCLLRSVHIKLFRMPKKKVKMLQDEPILHKLCQDQQGLSVYRPATGRSQSDAPG